MSDLTDRLREHVANMPAFPSAPWQAMHEAADIHSCHDNCARAGCVNARLRERVRVLEAAALAAGLHGSSAQ